MYYLQDAIKISRKGEDYTQLALFNDFNNPYFIEFNIPLKDLSIPQHYDHLKQAIKSLASIVIEFPYKDPLTKQDRIGIEGLLSASVPKINDRSSYMQVRINKDIARLLIYIDQNQFGQPINYTRFLYSIAQSAKNKYTSRIYKLICSWRKKGGFVISLDNFRKQLVLIPNTSTIMILNGKFLFLFRKSFLRRPTVGLIATLRILQQSMVTRSLI
jgi:plasmid replication initiation protein